MYNYEHAPSHWKKEQDKADRTYIFIAMLGIIISIFGFAILISSLVK